MAIQSQEKTREREPKTVLECLVRNCPGIEVSLKLVPAAHKKGVELLRSLWGKALESNLSEVCN